MSGILYGVGVGPGDPELITVKALRIMKECDIIAFPGEDPKESVAYHIAEQAYPEICRKEHLPLVTPMTKDRRILNENYAACAKHIEELLDRNQSVAMLTLGDPTVYSTYNYIQRLVLADGYRAEMISGVTSFCASAAHLLDSLADRSEQLHIIPASYQIEEALQLSGTKVLMKAASRLKHVREILKQHDGQVMMVENCGMPDETVYHSAAEIPDTGSYYSVLIVKDRETEEEADD